MIEEMLANLKLPARVAAICAALAAFMLPADMAHAQKEQFVRSKPHVNAGKSKPQSLYFPESMLKESQGQAGGAQDGKWKTFGGGGLQVHTKRKQKLKLKSDSQQSSSGLPTGKRQHKPFSLTKPTDKAPPSLLDLAPNSALGGTGAPAAVGGSMGGGGGGSGRVAR